MATQNERRPFIVATLNKLVKARAMKSAQRAALLACFDAGLPFSIVSTCVHNGQQVVKRISITVSTSYE